MCITLKIGMREDILKIFAEHNTVLSPDAWEYLSKREDAVNMVNNILCNCESIPFPVNVEWLRSFGKKKPIDIPKESRVIEDLEIPDVTKTIGESPAGNNYEIKIIHDITGNSTCTGELGDFVVYFNDRYSRLKSILSRRREAIGFMDIARVEKRGGKAKVIAILGDISESKGGYKFLTLEDPSGRIKGLINPNSPAYEKDLLEDEVVLITGEVGKKKGNYDSTIFIEDIIRPSIPKIRDMGNEKFEGKIAFTGDIHVGSKSFMGDCWKKFIAWINSDEALDIKYLIIPGDIIDGIGIYPNQREHLTIQDIYEQYKTAADMFREIPERITIICIPGNHDMVRNPEPQPSLPQEIMEMFSSNVKFYGNPSFISVNGLKILMYHGSSITDLSDMLNQVDPKKPATAMVEMLERRHLAPVYGKGTPIAPEERDHLVIDEPPDIFVTGHMHRTQVDEHHGVVLINSSAWQDQTDYQKMRDIIPEPAKVVIVDTKSRKASIKSFL